MNQEHKNLWHDVLLAGIRTGMKLDKAVTYADGAVAAYRELEVKHELPWHEAPDWAEWAAYEPKTRTWWWHKYEPDHCNGEHGCYQAISTIMEFAHQPFPGDWKDSLQRRPG